MNRSICYTMSNKIENRIRSKHLIPYHVNPSIKYEVGNVYYSDYWGDTFKVLSVHYDRYNILQNAYIKWYDGNYGLICTDLDVSDYLFTKDTNNVYNTDIINAGRSFTGAEIIYWFYMNNITSMDAKYFGFWKYIDSSSSLRISDTARYFIVGVLLPTDIYVNCKLIRYKEIK